MSRRGNLLDKLNLKYKERGITPAPFGLRVETDLTNGVSVFKFDFKSQNKQANKTEILLDANDKFAFQRLGLFLLRDNVKTPGVAHLQSFPNPVVFPTASGFTCEHLECIFNGFLQLLTGNVVNIEKLPTHNFRFVPQTQALGTTVAAATPILDQFNPNAMMVDLENYIELDGGLSHELTLKIPSFSGQQIASQTTDIKHKVVFIADGYLLKGAGVYQGGR